MAELNINNLELDDNTFELLQDGDYHFTVESHEIGYYSGTGKIPANTEQVICYIDIPILKDGEVKTITVRNTLNIWKKALFAVRQFVECIGMVPEKGRMVVDLDEIDGKTGVCSITTHESSNGNEYNRIQQFYPPSKVPAVTMNDDAWAKKDDFLELSDDSGVPFDV